MSLHRLVIDAAKRHPGRSAVDGPLGRLTYAELDARAAALARTLAARGVRPGDRVLIWAPKSPGAVVAMQAVLRLGATYVPADDRTPLPRILKIAYDCSARAACSTGPQLAALRKELGQVVACVDLDGPHELVPGAGPDHPVAPDDCAYILYTSGSTGAPKGVSISHRNACAFVEWAVRELGATPDDRFANHAPFTFDLSVLDLYAAFAAGATVTLIPREMSYAPRQLVDFLHRERVSIWYSVPSALIHMMRDGGLLDGAPPPALRAILFAGEPFPIAGVRALAKWTTARLLNLYGPTETNVCTYHEVTPDDLTRDRPPPIGLACCGNRVWAERADGSVAGPGEEGELLVDGPTVMLGYWGRERHTGAYRTGDIVRVLSDGSFDYVGRRDSQVKVRGHRIELGEVEAVLGTHPAVGQAAVAVLGTGMDARLAAFVTVEGTAGPLSLKKHVALRLPAYMIPDEIFFIDMLPQSYNGKVDRSALLDLAG